MKKVLTTQAQKNAAFKKLPKAQQRVEIAKDILKMIRKDALAINSGGWLTIDVPMSIYERKPTLPRQLQEIMPEMLREDSTCECCALGACFLGVVNKRNDFEIYDLVKIFTLKEMIPHLEKVFSYEQIILIEMAFEQGAGDSALMAPSLAKRLKFMTSQDT